MSTFVYGGDSYAHRIAMHTQVLRLSKQSRMGHRMCVGGRQNTCNAMSRPQMLVRLLSPSTHTDKGSMITQRERGMHI